MPRPRSTPRPSGRRRAPLSTERVLAAALKLADRDGVDGLSMRKLSSSLGYEVMSLYNHVTSKDDVLAGILQLVVAEIEPPPPGPWKPAVRATAVSAHQVLLRHPWAVSLWSSRGAGRAGMGYAEALLRTLCEGGLPASVAYHGYHAVLMHFLGFTQQQISFDLDDTSIAEMADEFLAQLPDDEFPYLAEHVRQHVHGPAQPTIHGDYEFVLDLILDGLERAAATERRRVKRR